MKISKKVMLGALGVKGTKIEERINPQNIKNLFSILSAKNPNIGCSMDEHICETLIINVATAIEKFNFEAINGIIGFKKPL